MDMVGAIISENFRGGKIIPLRPTAKPALERFPFSLPPGRAFFAKRLGDPAESVFAG